jgi:thiol-disulfide isomerase/thioredoxin
MAPGETATVLLGGTGRPVIGRLLLGEGFEAPPDWSAAHISFTQPPEEIDFPQAEIAELQEKMIPSEILYGTAEVRMAWEETEEGKEFMSAWAELTKDARAAVARNNIKRGTQRTLRPAQDGTFRFDDLPVGDWILTATLSTPQYRPIGTLEYTFTIADIPGGQSDEPLDLGDLEIERLDEQQRTATPSTLIRVGTEAPDFELVKINPIADDGIFEDTGERLRLSDFRGKYVILDFWATWCGPCLAKMPELKELYEKIKDDDRFVVIGVSLDDANSKEAVGKIIARRGIDWLIGTTGGWHTETVRNYGIQSIPTMLLIDTDGEVLLSNPMFVELVRKIDELR